MADLLTAWTAALPAALVAAAWCLLPGLIVTQAGGLRGVLAWGLAPAVSISTIAVGAIAATAAAVRWSPAVAALPAVGLALLVAAARLLLARLRRRRALPPPQPITPDGRPVAIAALAGSSVALVIAMVTVVDGMSLPTAVSQTYDAVFHYSAVARILAERDASSLTLGTLTTPGAEISFYPAAWHDLVSVVALSTAAPVPVASNVVAAVVAGVVWPLSCAALVRVVVGPSWPALAATPVVAVGFIAFPWSLLGFGVLWPNLIGLSMVPAALATVLAVVGAGAAGSLTRTRAVLLLPVLVVGLGLGHPNTLFSLAALAAFPVAGAAVRWLVRAFRLGRRTLAVLLGLAGLAVVAGTVRVLLTSSVFDEVRSFDWPVFATPLDAALDVALGATNNKEPAWVIAILVLVGAATCWRSGNRWLVPAHLATATLYVLAASSESDLAAALTGFWYNDSFRLAAMLPVTGVPLAVLGLMEVGSALHRVPPLSRVRADVLTALSAVGVLAATGGAYARTHASFVDDSYGVLPPGQSQLLDVDERAFFDEVAALVPPDAVVAQNPWTGSSLLWALTEREVLFPHLTGNWTTDQATLARALNEVAGDPTVCGAADRLDVAYLLVGVADFWPGDPRAQGFPGLEAPAPGPGFRLIAADRSGNALYEVTNCGPTASAPPSVPAAR